MDSEKSCLQITFDEGASFSKTAFFECYINPCEGHVAFLNIEIIGAQGENCRVSAISEYQIRQLIAYLTASLSGSK